MKNRIFSKGLVLGIILLFVGIAVAPGITATVNLPDTASTKISENIELNNDLVEIKVEVGNTGHTILLTPTQAEELENLIDSTKTRLDTSTTIEETSQIFDETVVSLNELGMLPDGMSVEDAQRLVNGNNRFSSLGKVLERLSGSNLGIFDDESNIFCLIAGETSNTWFYPLSFRLLLHMMHNLENEMVFYLCYSLIILLSPLEPLWLISPVVFGNNACLGEKPGGMFPPSPAQGWVFTIGLNGINIWDGKFYGILPIKLSFVHDESFVGIRGFNGISIYPNFPRNDCFYLGFATQVKIRYD